MANVLEENSLNIILRSLYKSKINEKLTSKLIRCESSPNIIGNKKIEKINFFGLNLPIFSMPILSNFESNILV